MSKLKFESSIVTPPVEETIRVVIELRRGRANALANAIDHGIVWNTTDVEDELSALYTALKGYGAGH